MMLLIVSLTIIVDAHVIGHRGLQQQQHSNKQRLQEGFQSMASYFGCHDQGSAYHEQDCYDEPQPPQPTTNSPTSQPPTAQPSTKDPTREPTREPTRDPTRSPTRKPTIEDGVASQNLRIYHDGIWRNVYCDGATVRVSLDNTIKHDWIQEDRFLINDTTESHLFCPEINEGYAPSDCACNPLGGRMEGWHYRYELLGRPGGALPYGEEVYVGQNNGFEACLKLIRTDELHTPCNPEPDDDRKFPRCLRLEHDEGDFTTEEHNQACDLFMLSR